MLKPSRALGKQLGDVVNHPFRYKCLALLSERTLSPADLAQELDVEVEELTYHVRVLLERGAIELVEVAPGNRSVKHLYRAVQRAEIGPDDFQRMSVDERIGVQTTVMQLAFADMAQSMETQVLGQRPDHHCSRFPLTLDEEGWEEGQDIFARALEEIYEVTARVAARTADDPGRANIQARAAIFFFEMPAQTPPRKRSD